MASRMERDGNNYANMGRVIGSGEDPRACALEVARMMEIDGDSGHESAFPPEAAPALLQRLADDHNWRYRHLPEDRSAWVQEMKRGYHALHSLCRAATTRPDVESAKILFRLATEILGEVIALVNGARAEAAMSA